MFKNFLWNNRVNAGKKANRNGKYLSRQESRKEPKSVVECVHDVKVYSPFNEWKSTSVCYQDNQALLD